MGWLTGDTFFLVDHLTMESWIIIMFVIGTVVMTPLATKPSLQNKTMTTTQDLITAIHIRSKELSLRDIPDKDYESVRLAYHSYLDMVRTYQTQNGISGLVEKTVKVGKKAITFHETHFQLATLDSDLEILKAEKESVLNFFLGELANSDSDFGQPFMTSQTYQNPEKVSVAVIEDMVNKASFTNLDYPFCPYAFQYELRLTIGWGEPETCVYICDTGFTKHFVRYPEQ